MKNRLFQSIGVGSAAAAVASALWLAGTLDRFEFPMWSWRADYFAKRCATSPQVKVILLDQASLDWGSRAERGWSWPWPREVYGPVIDFCKRGGAKVIAFDILFTENSVHGVADDRALADAIRRAGCFVGAAFYGRDRVTRPIPEVAEQAAAVANVSDTPDADGIFRRATLICRQGDHEVLSLGFAAWKLGAGNDAGQQATRPPLDDANRMILNFCGTNGTHSSYSMASVIQSELQLQAGERPSLSPSVFSNAYVLVGYSAPGLMDLRPTPVSRIAPGVEIHATVVDNLLTRRLLRDASRWAVASATWVLACLAAWLVLCAGRAWHSVLAFAVCLPIPFAAGFLGYAAGMWWPIVPALLAVASALVSAIVLNYATEGRQKAFIKRAFRFYLGEEVIDQILDDPSRLKLGGEKREVTVFFSDIESFSSFSERLDPSALITLLNDYLSDMSAIIKEEGGYLDKYIGDAIVAFWNAPVAQPDHATRALRAALRCQRRLSERRAEYELRTGVVLRARIGLNTGEAVVGNMGSYERFNYTILGDAANLASRLEGANKAFGTYLMVSENAWRRAGGAFMGRELAQLRVVGRQQPVRVFELAGFPDEPRPDSWTVFDKARLLFAEGRFEEARVAFEGLRDDPASEAYARQCRRLIEHRPTAWDGVWGLNEK